LANFAVFAQAEAEKYFLVKNIELLVFQLAVSLDLEDVHYWGDLPEPCKLV
jgi:hypothetical protein